MDSDIKNFINANLASQIQIGDIVQVIKTGKIGVVTKKIDYNRERQEWESPYGYTSIQVSFGSCKHNYSARNLQIITSSNSKQKGENNGENN